MSFVSGLAGSLFGGSGKGSDFTAQSANVLNPTTVDQANQAYGNTQTGLQQQQAFLQALQGQNGIQNQSNVFNQLQGVANGTGPNPAQAMLANSTGQNVANQAALMAGQRGAGSNVGLMARQAAQQGAGIQQNAAGQAAALQSQQQLGALGQLGGISGQQVANQGQAVAGYNQAAQGQQSNLLNSIAQQNNANVSNANQQNSANASIAKGNQQASNGLMGGLLGAAGTAITGGLAPAVAGLFSSSGADSFQLPTLGSSASQAATGGSNFGGLGGGGLKFAEGGAIPGPSSRVGQHLKMAKGGKVPVMLSPGEKALSPKEATKVAKGEESVKSVGKTVPGKPDGAKDDLKNDTFPTKLKEGGMVIPNSIMQSSNPEWAAHAFVKAHMAMGGKAKKKK